MATVLGELGAKAGIAGEGRMYWAEVKEESSNLLKRRLLT